MITSNPLPGLQLGFLFRRPYVMTSKFDERRDYSRLGGSPNDKHAGCDYDLLEPGVWQPEVLAPFPGVVTEVGTARAPGKFVKVESLHMWDADTPEPQGRFFTLTFGGLCKTFVTPGILVDLGQPLGEIGNSKDSLGEDLHLILQVPGSGLPGYIYPDVWEPDQYFPGHPRVSYAAILPR